MEIVALDIHEVAAREMGHMKMEIVALVSA